jgi:3',5'-cyclic AMP phosphodiesterase CpdA
MPRLWIFSDLHQDWADNAWDPLPHAPPFDIAIIAGDLHSPLTKAIDWLGDRFGGAPTIYVPGNHDFWWDRGDDRYTHADQIARGRDLAARRGIHLLSDGALTLNGVRFLGSTLWTDMRFGTWSLKDATRSAGRFMNDYRRIRRKSSGKHKYVRPIDTLALHRTSRAWIDDQMGVPFAGPTVVVSHHAPHPMSLPDGGFDLAHCYASDLSRLIHDRQPSLWVHGHLHSRSDYRIGNTRIVCNARGHVDEASNFDPAFTIDVGDTDGRAR